MNITPEIKKELGRLVWDYAIDEQTLYDILEGKTSTFSLNREKLLARLLLNTKWYRLLDCLGPGGLKEILTDEVIRYIWVTDLRERFFYAKNVLNEIAQ